MLLNYKEGKLRGRFRPEHPLESRTRESHADEFLSIPLRIVDVHDPPLRREVRFPAP